MVVKKISALYPAMAAIDIAPENSLHAVFLRSSAAAGTITRLDCSAARKAPGGRGANG